MIYNLYYKFFNNCLQNNKNVCSFQCKCHLILIRDFIISTCMHHDCALSHMEYNIILWKTLWWINNCRWKIIENSLASHSNCGVRIVFRVSSNIFISNINIVAILSIKSFHSLAANCRWCVDIVQMKLGFWQACVRAFICVCMFISLKSENFRLYYSENVVFASGVWTHTFGTLCIFKMCLKIVIQTMCA